MEFGFSPELGLGEIWTVRCSHKQPVYVIHTPVCVVQIGERSLTAHSNKLQRNPSIKGSLGPQGDGITINVQFSCNDLPSG